MYTRIPGLSFLILLFVLASLSALGQELTPEEMQAQLEAEMADDEEFEDDDEEDAAPRTPPAPNRFRRPSPRFQPRSGGNRGASNRGGFRRGGSGGGGSDRLGKTTGEIEFRLVDPPEYYLRKNKPYKNLPKSQGRN